MFNLLPDSIKKKIKTEYRLRLLVIVLAFALFMQVSFLIFLFPSWLVSVYKEQEVLSQTETINKSPLFSDISSVTSIVTSINAELNVINSALEYPRIVPFVNTILSKKTRDIYINELIYTSTGKTTATIALSGISATRESLVAFVGSLKETESFSAVDLPISNFVKDRNIDFSLNISITQ